MPPQLPSDHDVSTGNYDAKMKPLDDFMWAKNGDYHKERKKAMLQKYPQIEKLMVVQPLTAPILLALVAFQIFLAIYLRDSYDKWYYYVVAYVFGGTLAHAIFLGIHEVTHFLAFKSVKANYLLAMIANWPILFPYCASFKQFHHDHHIHLGVEGIDADLPTKFEAVLFHNVLGKAFFATCQIFFYALRPVIVHTKALNFWNYANIASQVGFVSTLFYFYGYTPFIFLFLSDFLAGSLHPCAAHFLAEHIAFVPGYETYSYYGALNILSFNVGYHNEHHDFPNIPWTNLPKLKEIAPEFYNNIPYHSSWTQVLVAFMTNPNISLYNRVKRKSAKKDN